MKVVISLSTCASKLAAIGCSASRISSMRIRREPASASIVAGERGEPLLPLRIARAAGLEEELHVTTGSGDGTVTTGTGPARRRPRQRPRRRAQASAAAFSMPAGSGSFESVVTTSRSSVKYFARRRQEVVRRQRGVGAVEAVDRLVGAVEHARSRAIVAAIASVESRRRRNAFRWCDLCSSRRAAGGSARARANVRRIASRTYTASSGHFSRA